MKKSFSFRRSWLDAINLIEDETLRAEITLIVVNYGLTGELTESSSDVVNAMVALIVSQITRRQPHPTSDTDSKTIEDSTEKSSATSTQNIENTHPSISSLQTSGQKKDIRYFRPHLHPLIDELYGQPELSSPRGYSSHIHTAIPDAPLISRECSLTPSL